jgi:hypothetical protein
MNIQDLESRFNRIQELYESDQISDQEYAVLIRSLDLETAISNHASDLQRRHQLYDAVVAASKLVKTII